MKNTIFALKLFLILFASTTTAEPVEQGTVRQFWQPSYRVNATISHEGMLYLGGTFDQLLPSNRGFAIIDSTTNVALKSPDLDFAEVLDMVPVSDGAWVILVQSVDSERPYLHVDHARLVRIEADGTVSQDFNRAVTGAIHIKYVPDKSGNGYEAVLERNPAKLFYNRSSEEIYLANADGLEDENAFITSSENLFWSLNEKTGNLVSNNSVSTLGINVKDISAIARDGDKNIIAIAGEVAGTDKVVILDQDLGKTYYLNIANVNAISFSKNGRNVFISSDKLICFELPDAKIRWTYTFTNANVPGIQEHNETIYFLDQLDGNSKLVTLDSSSGKKLELHQDVNEHFRDIFSFDVLSSTNSIYVLGEALFADNGNDRHNFIKKPLNPCTSCPNNYTPIYTHETHNHAATIVHAIDESKIAVKGRFTSIGGIPANKFAALDEKNGIPIVFSEETIEDISQLKISSSGKYLIADDRYVFDISDNHKKYVLPEYIELNNDIYYPLKTDVTDDKVAYTILKKERNVFEDKDKFILAGIDLQTNQPTNRSPNSFTLKEFGYFSDVFLGKDQASLLMIADLESIEEITTDDSIFAFDTDTWKLVPFQISKNCQNVSQYNTTRFIEENVVKIACTYDHGFSVTNIDLNTMTATYSENSGTFSSTSIPQFSADGNWIYSYAHDSFSYIAQINIVTGEAVKTDIYGWPWTVSSIRDGIYYINQTDESLNLTTKLVPQAGILKDQELFGETTSIMLDCLSSKDVPCEKVYYSLDNIALSEVSKVYKDPIVLEKSTIIRYQAIGKDGSLQPAQSKNYLIDRLPPIVFTSHASGRYKLPMELQINCVDDTSGCVELSYTVNGRAGKTNGYNDPKTVMLVEPTTIEATATDAYGRTSEIYRFEYSPKEDSDNMLASLYGPCFLSFLLIMWYRSKPGWRKKLDT